MLVQADMDTLAQCCPSLRNLEVWGGVLSSDTLEPLRSCLQLRSLTLLGTESRDAATLQVSPRRIRAIAPQLSNVFRYLACGQLTCGVHCQASAWHAASYADS